MLYCPFLFIKEMIFKNSFRIGPYILADFFAYFHANFTTDVMICFTPRFTISYFCRSAICSSTELSTFNLWCWLVCIFLDTGCQESVLRWKVLVDWNCYKRKDSISNFFGFCKGGICLKTKLFNLSQNWQKTKSFFQN